MRLSRLLFRDFGYGRLAGAGGGALLGWLLLFGGLQVWLLMDRNPFNQEELLAPEYLIIHKPVPVIKLLGGSGVAFSASDIAEIRKQPFVKAAAPFVPNRFRAHAFIGADSAASVLETDLFFEAVPDEFLDVKGEAWNWRPGTEELPIIVPRDYLALYNFGFAPSQNLPQISDNLIGLLRFTVRVSGRGTEREFKGRIVGFSNRINSILVPSPFLDWANATFGEGQTQPSRLIVKTDNPSAPLIQKYFTSKNYQYNSDPLKTAQLKSTLRLLLLTLSAFGLVILVLAFWIVALSFQLLIARNSERLQKLIWIGYPPGAILNRYLGLLLVLVLLVNLSCLVLLGWGTGYLVGLCSQYGFAVHQGSLWTAVLGMSLLSLSILSLHYFILRKQINRLA